MYLNIALVVYSRSTYKPPRPPTKTKFGIVIDKKYSLSFANNFFWHLFGIFEVLITTVDKFYAVKTAHGRAVRRTRVSVHSAVLYNIALFNFNFFFIVSFFFNNPNCGSKKYYKLYEKKNKINSPSVTDDRVVSRTYIHMV